MANLVAGEDYYIENGAWVFTEKFLRARGFCCGSGCRHCPYLAGSEDEKNMEQSTEPIT